MEIRPVGSRGVPCGQTDGQTDMMKLNVVFRDIAKAPKEHWRSVCASWAKETVEGSVITRALVATLFAIDLLAAHRSVAVNMQL